ncbi:MAG: DHHW family protein [Eubacterium sp.]|nr:DHHW family protein [Eubacterium sp.]
MGNKKKVLLILQVVCFLLLLGAGSAAVLFGACENKSYSELEKRELAPFPEVKAADIFSGKYESEFTEALSDHTRGRDLFVSAKTWVQIALGTREIDGIYIDGDRLIETYRDSDFFDKQIHDNIANVAGFMSATASGIGADHVKLALVPSKCSLYRDEMPGYMPGSDRADTVAQELRDALADNLVKGQPTEPATEDTDDTADADEATEDGTDDTADPDEDEIGFDFDEGDPDAEEDEDFEEESEEEESEDDVEEEDTEDASKLPLVIYDEASARAQAEHMVLDLRPVLEAHKTEDIYYLTDHHWTTLGAAYAYAAMQETAAETITGIPTETVTDDFLGTDYNRIHYYRKKDTIRQYTIPEADRATVEINDSGDVSQRDSIYDKDALQTADKYNYFFSGNYSAVTVHTGANNGKTMLMIKDSFSNSLVPFLCRDYQTIIMVDLRYVNSSIYDYLPEGKAPDDVWIVYNEEKFMQDTHQGYLR